MPLHGAQLREARCPGVLLSSEEAGVVVALWHWFLGRGQAGALLFYRAEHPMLSAGHRSQQVCAIGVKITHKGDKNPPLSPRKTLHPSASRYVFHSSLQPWPRQNFFAASEGFRCQRGGPNFWGWAGTGLRRQPGRAWQGLKPEQGRWKGSVVLH